MSQEEAWMWTVIIITVPYFLAFVTWAVADEVKKHRENKAASSRTGDIDG